MSTCVMKRMTVWACKDDADTIAGRLVRLRCVDVDVASPDADKSLVRYDPSARIRECEAQLSRIDEAMKPLYPYSHKKGGLVREKLKVNREAIAKDVGGIRTDTEACVEKINSIKRRQEAIERELADAESGIAAAKPWLGCGFELDTQGTDRKSVV